MTLGLLLPPPLAAGGNGKGAQMSASVEKRAARGRPDFVDVIVQFDRHPGKAQRDEITGRGGQVRDQFEHFPMLSLRVPENALKGLAMGNGVRYISMDSEVVGFSLSAKQTANLPVASFASQVSAMPDVAVAVLDSGLDSDHLDLNERKDKQIIPDSGVCIEWDDDECEEYHPDSWGHGTHVAGIIGGSGELHSTYSGIAPNAPIVSVRVLDEVGRGQVSDVIKGLDYVLKLVADGNQYDIRVVNLSLGKALEEPAADDPLVQAVEAVWDAGIVVVVSAGN
jgi:serine protease AprX